MPFPTIPFLSSVNIPPQKVSLALLGKSIVCSAESTFSAFAGQALNAKTIQHAGKKWGIYDPTLEDVRNKDGHPVYKDGDKNRENDKPKEKPHTVHQGRCFNGSPWSTASHFLKAVPSATPHRKTAPS